MIYVFHAFKHSSMMRCFLYINLLFSSFYLSLAFEKAESLEQLSEVSFIQ